MSQEFTAARQAPQGLSVGMQPAPESDLRQGQLPSIPPGGTITVDPYTPASLLATPARPGSSFVIDTGAPGLMELADFSFGGASEKSTAGVGQTIPSGPSTASTPAANGSSSPASGAPSPQGQTPSSTDSAPSSSSAPSSNPSGNTPQASSSAVSKSAGSKSAGPQDESKGTSDSKNAGTGQSPAPAGGASTQNIVPTAAAVAKGPGNGDGSSGSGTGGSGNGSEPPADQSLTSKPTIAPPMWKRGLFMLTECIRAAAIGFAGGNYGMPKPAEEKKKEQPAAAPDNTAQQQADAAREKAQRDAAADRAKAAQQPTGASGADQARRDQGWAQEDLNPSVPGNQTSPTPPAPNPLLNLPPDLTS